MFAKSREKLEIREYGGVSTLDACLNLSPEEEAEIEDMASSNYERESVKDTIPKKVYGFGRTILGRNLRPASTETKHLIDSPVIYSVSEREVLRHTSEGYLKAKRSRFSPSLLNLEAIGDYDFVKVFYDRLRSVYERSREEEISAGADNRNDGLDLRVNA